MIGGRKKKGKGGGKRGEEGLGDDHLNTKKKITC